MDHFEEQSVVKSFISRIKTCVDFHVVVLYVIGIKINIYNDYILNCI